MPPSAASSANPGPAPDRPSGYLPRLTDNTYCGHAIVFWTLTMRDRHTGWLTPNLHVTFRELLLHASARQNLWCPVYVLMPDHLHLIWMGMASTSDQRKAMTFLRRQLAPHLTPARLQHQAHDHVLRPDEKAPDCFASTVHYICENPVRAGLINAAANWPSLGCIVPGYPDLHPLRPDYWDLFWKLHNAAV